MSYPALKYRRRSSRLPALRGLLGALVCTLLFVSGCDSTGSEDEPEPPGETEDSSAFTSTSVTVESDTLALPGTLFLPDTSATVPGVVIVHGSGPVGRDGQVPGTNLPPIYERWGERMARRGLAVLRYDKRTTLPEIQQADLQALTFLDFVHDAVAAGHTLRERDAIDPNRLVFVGHSQGGNVAPAAATRLGQVAGVAALASPALAVDLLFVAQLEAGSEVGCSPGEVRAQFDSLRAGRPVSDGLICGSGTTFWRQWIRHSQKADSIAAALQTPLLVQQGRADQNYPGETLSRNLEAWRGIARNSNATLRAYDNVDHLFLRANTTEPADAPLDELVDWIQER